MDLVCRGCGERIVPSTWKPGTFTHVSRVVAACDLNSDHRPEPDPAALGTPPCTVCGAPVTWRGGAFVHVDGEADHPAGVDL